MNSGPLCRLSFPTFPLLFFPGCNSTSRPAGGSLPSPNHSSARAGLNHCQLHQTSRGALVSLQSDSALKLPLVLLWRDYYSTPTHTWTHTHTRTHTWMCVFFRLTTSPISHLSSAPPPRGPYCISMKTCFPHLISCICECDDTHTCINYM